jgi:hypothetical protein
MEQRVMRRTVSNEGAANAGSKGLKSGEIVVILLPA